MDEVINKRNVLKHPVSIIRGFGWKVFFYALCAPKGRIFLDILSQGISSLASPRQVELSLQIDKLVSFEMRCAHIYARLNEIYHEREGLARDFFHTLSEQEVGHAEILRIIKARIARLNLWDTLSPINPDLIERIDKFLSEIEESLSEVKKLKFSMVLELVEELESSEINVVFDFLLHSMSTAFLKKIHRLTPSIANHKMYLNNVLPRLKKENITEK